MKKIILLFSGVFVMLSGYSQAGQPDLSFGNGGSITPQGGGPIAIQNDGKIIQVSASSGDFMVTRFNVDGSLDNTFNGTGKVITDFGLASEVPKSVLVQPDGKIIVAGVTTRDNPPDYRILVARYNPDGSLDQTFHGTGFNSVGNTSDNAYLAMESNGSILVAGEFSITRFKSNGDTDNSFGSNVGTLRTGNQLTANYAIAVQTDGKIVLGGFRTSTAYGGDFTLVRYNPDGSLDSSFDSDGVVITRILNDLSLISSLLIQPDGKILAAGTAYQSGVPGASYVLARYNTNGLLDSSFDGDGILFLNLGSRSDPVSYLSIALQGDNRIIASGNNLLLRLLSNGQLDNTFDGDGIAAIDIQARRIAIRENRVYIAGTQTSVQAIGAYRLDIAPQTGLFYKYYEGTWTTLPDFNSLTAVKSGNTDNINLEVRTPGRNDNFAFIWRGYINITTPGSYTFETVSDDGSKLYFNAAYSAGGIALVNNDGIHAAIAATGTINIPSAGLYPITFTYFENNGGETMQAYWTGPGIPRQLIPNSAFGGTTTPLPTEGLNYKYYEGTWNTLPDFTLLTPVKTGNTPNIDLGVRTPGRNDNFAFVWEGTINIPAPGAYTFTTTSDDGSKLYFNSQYVPSATATVNNDGLHAPTAVSGTVTVAAAGAYPIAITFFEKDGGEQMSVSWSGPGFTSQPIPNSAFSKSAATRISGLTYKFYQGSFDFLPDFNTLVPVKTGNTPNIDIGVRPADVNDNFAFVWEGWITLPSSGSQEFRLLSDDGSRLIINGTTVINNDGTHGPQTISGTINLPAGTYPVSISYFDKTGGEAMELYWFSGQTYLLVPNSAFTTTKVETPVQMNGLNYKYYEGTWNALPDFSSLTPVKTGTSANIDISTRIAGRNDNFAFVWEGNITLPTPGDYLFELVSDDGSKFYFNSGYSPSALPLINNDGIHAATSVSATVNASGTHPIAVTYFEKDGGETIQLYWTGPGIARQLVPASAFTTTSGSAVNKDAVGLQPGAANIASDRARVTRIYPNPFAERFFVSFYNEKTTDQISVAVYDINGKQMYSQYAGKLSQGTTSLMIDLKNKQLKDGIYFVTIMKNGVRSQTVKLIKQ